MAVLGNLVVNLGMNSRGFTTGINNAQGSMDKFSSFVAGASAGIAASLATAFMSAGAAGARFFIDMGVGMVNLAADAEVAQMNFEILLGDTAKGAKMFQQIERFAGRTSFNIESASEAATRLLATGVAEDNVITTMQLLGDLALGDANKLGFLSKAYTDVMNKGKLSAQETKQFSENGIGLMAALATTTGKTVNELTKMGEAGEISFQMVQEALIGLTTGTGRFTDALEKGNTTFRGQWNSLIESIQGFGRDLGELVLPALKDLTSEANKLLQGFRMVEDKSKVIGDLLESGMKIAMLTIAIQWEKMLEQMALKTYQTMSAVMKSLAVGGKIGDVAKSLKGIMGGPASRKELDLEKKRFGGILDGIKANKPPEEVMAPLIDPVAKPDGSKLAALAGDVAEGAKGMFGQLAQAAQNKLTDVKMKGGWLGSVVKNMFTGDRSEGEKKQETKFAGAMQKGSQEAYSTLVQAMFRGKDPIVDATEKQTIAIVNAIHEDKAKKFAKGDNNPPKFAAEVDAEPVKQIVARQQDTVDAFNPKVWNAINPENTQRKPKVRESMPIQAMMSPGKDPNVKATEKQTAAIVKAVKEAAPLVFNFVGAFG